MHEVYLTSLDSPFCTSNPLSLLQLFLRLLKSPPFLFLTPFFPPHTPPYSTPFTAEIAANTHAPASPTIPTSTSSSAPTIQPPATDAPTASPSSSTPYPHLIPSQPRRNRPALLVSSTSWTPDEDFGMLLEALGIYDARARAMNYRAHDNNNNNEPGVVTPLPKVLMVVTGKGPLKERYMREVEALQDGWQWVRCISLWLEAEDYPVLLGSFSPPSPQCWLLMAWLWVIRLGRPGHMPTLQLIGARSPDEDSRYVRVWAARLRA